MPTMASLTNGFRPETSPFPSRTAWTSPAMWVKTSLKILQESLPLSSSPPSWYASMLHPPLQYLKIGQEAHFSLRFIDPTRIFLKPSDWKSSEIEETSLTFPM